MCELDTAALLEDQKWTAVFEREARRLFALRHADEGRGDGKITCPPCEGRVLESMPLDHAPSRRVWEGGGGEHGHAKKKRRSFREEKIPMLF